MAKNSKYQLLMKIDQNLFLMMGLPKIASWGAKDRPKKVGAGTIGFNTKTNSIEYYNGKDWFTARMGK